MAFCYDFDVAVCFVLKCDIDFGYFIFKGRNPVVQRNYLFAKRMDFFVQGIHFYFKGRNPVA